MDPRFWIAVLAVLVVAAAWIALGVYLHHERDHAIHRAHAHTASLARAFAEHVLRTVKSADQAVLTLAAEFRRKGARIDIPALQRSGVLASKIFALVGVVGPDGRLLAASVPFKPIYLGDREHVRVHLQADIGELYIGKPVFGRTSKKWSIHLTRRVDAPDGSPMGVVSVALDPKYFSDFYGSIDFGRGGVITLVGRDGIVRAAFGGADGGPRLGEDVRGSALFEHATGSRVGTYLKSEEGEVEGYLVSFDSLAEYPLIVSVAMAEDEVLAAYHARSRRYYLAMAVFTACVLGLSALLARAFTLQTRIARALREREVQRSEAEKSLRESEARFRTLFEKAPMAIVIVNSEGTILDANPAYLSIFGFGSLDEARGFNAIELYDTSQREEMAAVFERWREGDTGEYKWERVRMRRDGTRFHAETHVLPMRFPDGIARVAFATDVSERRRMQEDLQRAKERMELAMRGAQLTIWDLDCATRTVTVGEHHAAGHEGECVERHCTLQEMDESVHPADRARVRRDFVDLLKGGTPHYAAQHRVKSADGAWRWVAWRATVVARDPSGRALRVTGTIADITAHKRMKEELRRTETKLSRVTANVPGMVFEMTCRGGRPSFDYVSQGSEALLAIAPEALRRDPERLLQAIWREDRRAFEDALALAMESGQMWTWEGRVCGTEGRARWIQLRAVATGVIDTGSVWDGIATDVTRIKENERALAEAKLLLRELSAHHEAAREQERTRIARELHDELGQLLTGLKLSLSAAAERDGALEQAFSKAQNARVMHLVEQAIAVTRNVILDLRPPALDQGLGAAVAWLADQFARRTGIACSVEMPEEEIELDERRGTALFRVLQESLTNVAKHASARCVCVRLAVDCGSVQLTVVDDGKGFTEADATSRRTFGLIGMRERMSMLGGSVRMDSAPGEGTTVHAEFVQMKMAAAA